MEAKNTNTDMDKTTTIVKMDGKGIHMPTMEITGYKSHIHPSRDILQ